MNHLLAKLRKAPSTHQVVIGVMAIGSAAILSHLLLPRADYRLVALLLLLCNSMLGVLFRPLATFLLAAFSAVIWNFFFIPPIFTFHISDAHDAVMFLMYFMVAAATSFLQHRIDLDEQQARRHQEATKSLHLYNAVFNSLSHELRTPIATILGSADVMLSHHNPLPNATSREMLQDIQEAALRLQAQVNGLLAMSRLESGQLTPRLDWTDVNEVVYRALHSFSPWKERIHFQATADLPLVHTDGTLLEHIVSNLVKNALQHTSNNAQVRIVAGIEHDVLVLSVADQGAGIAAADQARMFERFHRGTGAAAGGLGLGLSIVRGFTTALGGTVEYTQQTGDFPSHFTVRIPSKMSFINALHHE